MDMLAGKILGFLLVMTRVGAFFSVSPVFSWQAIPVQIKVSVAIIISIFFSVINVCPLNSEDVGAIQVCLMMANEAIYGLALGLIASMLFTVVKIGGRIIERQMGLSMASVLDPLSGDNGQPLGLLMEMIFILLLLSANGHHMFLLTISKSYDVFAIGTIPTIDVLLKSIMIAGSTMLTLGLKLSAPILGAFLLMMVVLAIMARAAPEANILFLSLPLRVGLGLMMVAIFIPFISGFIAEFSKWMDRLLPL